jgi:hypothetical protein
MRERFFAIASTMVKTDHLGKIVNPNIKIYVNFLPEKSLLNCLR